MIRFAWGVSTDVGRVRAVNQDNAVAREGLFAVADGMGGHRGGEVAAEIAVTTLESHVPILTTTDLVRAIETANEAVLDAAASDRDLDGMGTTLCAIALVHHDGEDRLAVANVGDSRVYALTARTAELQQLTEDHSLVAQMVRDGTLSPADAEYHPKRNVLTRALGIESDLAVDAWEIVAAVGDRFVLCSDGLYNELSADQIGAVLRRLADPREAATELTQLANANGGRDNITVVVVDVVEADNERASASAISLARAAEPDLAGFATATETDARLAQAVTPRRALIDDVDAPLVETREPRPPLFTIRTAIFGFGIAVIALGAFFGVVWMKNHTFVVKYDAEGRVAIFRGKVLWYGEELLEVPNPELTSATLAETDNTRVAAGHHTDSRNKARGFVRELEENIKRREAVIPPPTTAPSITTTTTTTAPATTAVPATTAANLAVPTRG